MERVTHHGRSTAYEAFDRGGEGPSLLFVHGAGGGRGVWKSQARLADEFPVVALDLSGHGDSDDVDADPGFETLEAYATDVEAVRREAGGAVLVGSSLGAAVCLHMVINRDAAPEGLVLAGAGPRLPVLSDLLGWLADDFDRAVEFLHAPGRLFADPSEELVAVSEAAMRETGRAVVERDFRTCHGFDVEARLGAVDVPSLAVVGEEDRLTPRWYHEELARGIPRCGLAVVEDAGHLAMLERPGAFNAVLREYLTGL